VEPAAGFAGWCQFQVLADVHRLEHGALGQHERHIALQQALAELSEEQRAAVALCLGGGWSHPEAAQILSMPLGTLKSHRSRGRARLEAILGASHD
jgi:DNA-directed RNA polymerase specialized sigma24 family protein